MIWETFINQEQLSRSTKLQPLDQHNLINDGQDDEGDDGDGDDGDDGDNNEENPDYP